MTCLPCHNRKCGAPGTGPDNSYAYHRALMLRLIVADKPPAATAPAKPSCLDPRECGRRCIRIKRPTWTRSKIEWISQPKPQPL